MLFFTYFTLVYSLVIEHLKNNKFAYRYRCVCRIQDTKTPKSLRTIITDGILEVYIKTNILTEFLLDLGTSQI
jgi:hypothetical protein